MQIYTTLTHYLIHNTYIHFKHHVTRQTTTGHAFRQQNHNITLKSKHFAKKKMYFSGLLFFLSILQSARNKQYNSHFIPINTYTSVASRSLQFNSKIKKKSFFVQLSAILNLNMYCQKFEIIRHPLIPTKNRIVAFLLISMPSLLLSLHVSCSCSLCII